MAKERYINADTLIERLRATPVPYMNSGYNSGPLDQALHSALQMAFSNYHYTMMNNIIAAIDEASTLDGPCMLCRQRDGDIVPENTYCANSKAG